MSKKYELLLILPGTLDEKEAENRSQEILNLIKENSQDTEINSIGKNRLAYPIKQIRYGYFYTIVFNAKVDQVKAIQGKLELMRDVLRAMVTHFNTQLTASQKIAYTTDNTGITTMVEKNEVVEKVKPDEEKVVSAPRKAEKLNLEEISKKLDDLMSGDVSGV